MPFYKYFTPPSDSKHIYSSIQFSTYPCWIQGCSYMVKKAPKSLSHISSEITNKKTRRGVTVLLYANANLTISIKNTCFSEARKIAVYATILFMKMKSCYSDSEILYSSHLYYDISWYKHNRRGRKLMDINFYRKIKMHECFKYIFQFLTSKKNLLYVNNRRQ